jgi:hypothetical protein
MMRSPQEILPARASNFAGSSYETRAKTLLTAFDKELRASPGERPLRIIPQLREMKLGTA